MMGGYDIISTVYKYVYALKKQTNAGRNQGKYDIWRFPDKTC